LPILPILVDVIKALMPVIDFLILPLTWLGNMMQVLGPIIGIFSNYIADLFGMFQPLIDMLGGTKGSMKILEAAMTALEPIIGYLAWWIEWVGGAIKTLTDKITDAFGKQIDSLIEALNVNTDSNTVAIDHDTSYAADDYNIRQGEEYIT